MEPQAPHSLEAEQSVLGAMLIDSRCVPDVIGLLKPEDFYLQQNREIYETIYTMFHFSQVIDPVTVLDKMQERGCGRRPPRSISSSSWKSPPPRPTRPGTPPLSGTRPCCAPWPRPLRRFPRPSMRESARPRRFWSRRSGRFTPCARASGARAWSPSAWCCTRCSTASRSWPSPTARSRGFPRAWWTWTGRSTDSTGRICSSLPPGPPWGRPPSL